MKIHCNACTWKHNITHLKYTNIPSCLDKKIYIYINISYKDKSLTNSSVVFAIL